MKCFVFSILISLTIYGAAFSQNQEPDYLTKSFREIRDKNFRDPNLTPLLPNDFANFKGLNFFAFDEKFRIKVTFERTTERKSFLMPTSTGTSSKYLKIADLKFKLDRKDLTLSAYSYEWASDHPKAKEEIKDVFVPFKDLTNGTETYGAGRYVYVRLPKDGNNTILDFNLAYNPNCAYGNETYSCTLPPKENFLQIEIKAGEKRFKF